MEESLAQDKTQNMSLAATLQGSSVINELFKIGLFDVIGEMILSSWNHALKGAEKNIDDNNIVENSKALEAFENLITTIIDGNFKLLEPTALQVRENISEIEKLQKRISILEDIQDNEKRT